jgi:hypothetical protein
MFDNDSRLPDPGDGAEVDILDRNTGSMMCAGMESTPTSAVLQGSMCASENKGEKGVTHGGRELSLDCVPSSTHVPLLI